MSEEEGEQECMKKHTLDLLPPFVYTSISALGGDKLLRFLTRIP